MLNEPPTFEIAGNGELSDAAIEAVARLLLSLVDQDEAVPQDQEVNAKSA